MNGPNDLVEESVSTDRVVTQASPTTEGDPATELRSSSLVTPSAPRLADPGAGSVGRVGRTIGTLHLGPSTRTSQLCLAGRFVDVNIVEVST